jgi:hypothetical protein
MASLYSCFYQMEKRNIFARGLGTNFADLPVGQITLIRFNKFGGLRMNPVRQAATSQSRGDPRSNTLRPFRVMVG